MEVLRGRWRTILYYSLLSGFCLAPATVGAACGEIIDATVAEEERTPIEDCSNPFRVSTNTEAAPFSYESASTTLQDGDTITATTTPISVPILVQTGSSIPDSTSELYRHEGDDYRLLERFQDQTTIAATGTYTIVSEALEQPLSLRNNRWRWVEWLIPTVHAQPQIDVPIDVSGPPRWAITFEVVYEPPAPPEPDGASSVLFLPGIQASRLYTNRTVGGTNQLWEPQSGSDVREIRMDENGNSLDDGIYTEDVIDNIFGISAVYNTLIEYFDEQVENGSLQDWESYAYDWRYGVREIAAEGTQYKSEIVKLTNRIEDLAERSFSGQVTIIGHSNGGLLAKAALAELEEAGKEHLVDRVVFVAVPQLGTPKSIGSILHGYDQKLLGGFILTTERARETIQNFPGAYGLLPTESYFTARNAPLLFFDDSEFTRPFRDEYGNAVNDVSELKDLMLGARVDRPISTSPDVPLQVNEQLLNEAFADRAVLDTWQAPAGIEVVEVVGVGLETEAGFHYKKYRAVDGYAPHPIFTTYGDGTVVGNSAIGYDGEKATFYVDLNAVKNSQDVEEVEHVNITELEELLHLLDPANSRSNFDFISQENPLTENERFRIIGLHSPANVMIEDEKGRQTGFRNVNVGEVDLVGVISEIPNTNAVQLGESQYIVLPESGEFELFADGTGSGDVIITVDSQIGTELEFMNERLIADVHEETRISGTVAEDGLGALSVDRDGDGEVDERIENDVPVEPLPIEYSYDGLRELIKSYDLRRFRERFLLRQVEWSERFEERWSKRFKWFSRSDWSTKRLVRFVEFYGRRGIITENQREELIDYIQNIKKSHEKN